MDFDMRIAEKDALLIYTEVLTGSGEDVCEDRLRRLK
jgi:hypothetical protein